MIIPYTVPETWQVTDVIFIFHFGLFFCAPKGAGFLSFVPTGPLETCFYG